VPVPLLLIWAPNWGWVIAANVLLGVNQGLAWSTTVIMKIDLVGPSRRGLAMGLNEAAGYLAVAATAMATGYLAEVYGLRPAPFLLGAAFAALGLGLSTLAVRETRGHAHHEAGGTTHSGLTTGQVFVDAFHAEQAVWVPGRGLRLQRAVLASGGTGELFVDTLKNKRARTVPLVDELIPLVDRWAGEKVNGAWLFHAPQGGPLSEGNWKRSVRWSTAIKTIGVPTLRVHDLRHTAASVWLGSGADPKVVQRILGHASAAMTMDLYGHLIDQNLWDAARKIGGTTGARRELGAGMTKPPGEESGL